MADVIWLPDGRKDCFAAHDSKAFASLVGTYMGPEAETAFRAFAISDDPFWSPETAGLADIIDGQRDQIDQLREALKAERRQNRELLDRNLELLRRVRALAQAADGIVSIAKECLD